jgi:hypothetical protein
MGVAGIVLKDAVGEMTSVEVSTLALMPPNLQAAVLITSATAETGANARMSTIAAAIFDLLHMSNLPMRAGCALPF